MIPMFERDAGVYRLAFSIGLFSQEDLVSWVDAAIARTDRPSPEMIALSESAARHPLDVANLLDEIAHHGVTPQDHEIVIGLLSRKLREREWSPETAARALEHLGEVPKAGHWPDLLMTGNAEGKAGFEKQLLEFLREFEPFADAWESDVRRRHDDPLA